MKDKRAIVVDVDNTIFDQNTRKAFIMQDVLGKREISLTEISKDFTLSSIMKRLRQDEQEKFWVEFFSPGHYRGAKGLNIECYKDCSETLNLIAQKFRIIYVTARPDIDRQKEELLGQLSYFNLPMPSPNGHELYLMPAKELPLSHKDFAEKARKFKYEIIQHLASIQNIFAGIGDQEEDIAAFKSADLIAIQFNAPSFGQSQFQDSDLCFSNWQDIRNALDLLMVEDNPLSDLRQMHLREYADWLGDLDSKSRLLLVIDTALLATSMIWLREASFPDSLPFLVSSVSSVIAMVFCIRSFSSRRIRGIKAGSTVAMAGAELLNIWKCLIGSKPIPPGSPIEEAEIVRNGRDSRKKVAHIQFFMNNYGTLDPESVINMRLLELRALNYVKMFAEQWGRRFTFFTIVIIFEGLLLHYFLK